MESTPSYTNWQPVSKAKRPGMALFSALQAIAHGSDSVMYFQWRQSRGASEKFHGAVVSHDCREDNRVFTETCRVGEALEKLSFLAGEKKIRQAAIVHDWNNMWALEESRGPRNAGMGYWEEMLRHYRGLSRNGVSVDLINQDSGLDGYKLVVCPMLYMLREDFADKLRAFTAAGGTLLVTYWSGVVNETDLCYLGDAPHGLTDVLGLRRTEIDALYDGESRRCIRADGRLPEQAHGSALCEVAACTTAVPLMRYDEDFFAGTPAVATNEFGQGRAYYVATRFEKDFYEPLYREVCAGKIAPCWPCALPEGVMAVPRGRYTFLQNTLGTPVRLDTLDLEPYATAVFDMRGETPARVF